LYISNYLHNVSMLQLHLRRHLLVISRKADTHSTITQRIARY